MSGTLGQIILTGAGYAFGGQFGATVGSIVGAALFAEDIDLGTQEGPRLDDLKVQSSTYGRFIPYLYGASRLGGNIIWSSGINETRVEETTTQGGKGGPEQSATTVTYTYDASFALAICEGEIEGIAKIWADGTLLMNRSTDITGEELFASVFAGDDFTVYTGTETQTADPLIESYEGVGNVPGFRGLTYIVFENLLLTKYGNRIPNITVEVIQSATNDTTLTVADVRPDGFKFGSTTTDNNKPPYNHGFESGIVRVGRWHPAQSSTPPDNVESFTRAWSMDGSYLGEIKQTTDESFLPSEDAGRYVGDKFNNNAYWYSYDSNWDKEIARGTEILPVYTGQPNTSKSTYICDVTDALPDASDLYIGGCVHCVDNKHVLVLTGDDPGNKPFVGAGDSVNEWHLVYFDGRNVTRIDNGTISPAVGISTFKFGRSGNKLKFQFAIMEEDFLNVWRADHGSAGWQHWQIDNSDNLAIVGSMDSWTSTDSFQFGSLYATRGVCSLISGDSFLLGTRLKHYLEGSTLLSTIVSDLCLRTGLVAGDIDVTALTDTVYGYVVNKQTSARASLRKLQQAYMFDVVETDNKIVFIKRSAGDVITVDSDDLGATTGGRIDKLNRIRMNELELPRTLTVSHLDKDSDYQENTESASRLITDINNTKTIELPLTLTNSAAAQIVDILLRRAWIERNVYSGTLPFEYIKMNPSDILSISLNGATHSILLTEVSYALNGVISFSGVSEDIAQYDSTASSTTGGFTSSISGVSGPTNLELLDIPLLRSEDDSNGYYVSGGGYLSGWSAANLYKSSDDEETWNQLTTITNTAPLGVTSSALSDGLYTIFDYTNTINILLSSGTLQSSTEAGVLNGDNACLIGDELLHYVTAALESDGTYTLSGLLRGRKGTEWAMATHAASDRFVSLSITNLLNITQDTSEIGLERHYKAVSIGGNLFTTGSEAFTNNAVRLQPLSPVHIKGSRDASDNLTITWVRRARSDADWRDNIDVPLDETSEHYNVDVIVASAVVTTIVASTETASYPAANQTGDGITPGDPIDVNIFQISTVVGRGFAGSTTV